MLCLTELSNDIFYFVDIMISRGRLFSMYVSSIYPFIYRRTTRHNGSSYVFFLHLNRILLGTQLQKAVQLSLLCMYFT